MPTRLLLALAGALLLLRVPSLVQPMGPDQGLYAYVGDRILHHELAYRDAWDQKPPGIHYVYAALRAISHRDVVVPAADLAAAAITAALLATIGARLCGPLAGGLSAVLFLFLFDPSLARYGGFRVRAQAETFIALGVAGALARALRPPRTASRLPLPAFGAGLLIGAAFVLKYNAGLYALLIPPALMTGVLRAGTKETTYLGTAQAWRDLAAVAVGMVIVPTIMLIPFWRARALDDLYQATITYNLHYSGETYG